MAPTKIRKKLATSITPAEPKRIYSIVDLFAGCGGLSQGFENASFTPVFVNELNHDALNTYLKNRHHSLGGLQFSANKNLRENDAQILQGKRLEKMICDLRNIPEIDFQFDTVASNANGAGSTLDVLAGGPPCQGYSGIGIRRSYSVDRKEIPSNQLYQRMAQIIGRLRPRIFLFENVRGLLNAKWTKEGGEAIWPDVKTAFRAIPGYEVRWSLVYAKDYGVPQNRPRVLLVGIRKDILEACDLLDPNACKENAVKCGFLPERTPGEYPDLCDLLGDLEDPEIDCIMRSGDFAPGTLETKSYPHPAKTKIQRALRTAPHWNSRARVDLTEQEYSKHKPAVVQKFAYMLGNDGAIPSQFQTKKFSQRILRKRWGNHEPNITATSLADDYVHYSQPRVPTLSRILEGLPRPSTPEIFRVMSAPPAPVNGYCFQAEHTL